MQQEMKISIALVCQHDLFRQAFTNLLEGIDYPVESVTSYETIERLVTDNLIPDLVLQIVDKDGGAAVLETIGLLHLEHPSLPLLVLLPAFEETLTNQLKQSNASGYLLIDVEPSECRAAIKQVMKGKKYYQHQNRLQGNFENLPQQFRSLLSR